MRRLFAPAVCCCVLCSLSGCGDGGTGPAEPKPAALVVVGGQHQSGEVGSVLEEPLVVRVTDKRGEALGGVLVSWSAAAGNGVLSRSSVLTDSTGEASVVWTLAEGAGVQRVAASVAELAPVTFEATALAGRAAQVAVDPIRLDFDEIGATVKVSATVRDQYGNPLESPQLEWSSSDTLVAVVNGAGEVTSRGAGVALVEVISDTVRAAVQVSVDPGTGVGLKITSISPGTLVPGTHFTINGTGFSAKVSGNTVIVAGVEATVLSASSTELLVLLPPSNAFECRPSQPVNVVVVASGASTYRLHPLAVAKRLPALGVGEYADLTGAAELRCAEFPADGERFLISVYNTSTVPTAGVAFRLTGSESGVVAGSPGEYQATSSARPPSSRLLREAAPVASPLRGALAVPGGRSIAATQRAMRAHAELLEQNRALLARLGTPPRRGAGDPRLRVAAAPQLLAVDSIMEIRVQDVDGDLCQDYATVRARVVYAGQKAVVLEDENAPLARTMDARYEALGREFEDVMLPVVEEYFGDPFAFDEHLSGMGKILMLFTPKVNDIGNVAGFVTTVDFFPRSHCASSNLNQIFYAVVPTDTGSGYSGAKVDQWYRMVRTTVIHEVKHIVSYGERFARDASKLEDTWLEESTARLAEELWARRVYGNQFKGKANYRSTIYCEVRPTWPECTGKPWAMTSHFDEIYRYMSSPHLLSPVGRQGPDDWSFYGSGWLLLRWVLDHLAVDEAAFIKALVQEPNLSGVGNLTARTGRSFSELLGPWSLSLLWNQPTAPLLSHLSWDLYDIFAGLHSDFPEIFARRYPLAGWNLEFGDFQLDVPIVRGGSAAMVMIAGPRAGTQVIRLLGPSGGPPASTLRMAVLRVE